MGTHTPGPWRLIADAQGPCMVMHPKREGIAIASLTDTFHPAKGFHDDWEHLRNERNANAYLIAAAPELLDAVRDYLEDLKGRGGAFTGERLTNLIAKAEGKQ